MILWEYIRRKLLEHPMQRICEKGVYITYEELCVFAEHRAKDMTAPFYGILCKSELAAAISLLCCFAAERMAVPMPFRYGQENYLKILDRANPPYIFTDYNGSLCEMEYDLQMLKTGLEDPAAVVLFTSGSTGVPKGVVLSEENILANIRDIAEYFPICSTDTILISRPIYHSSVMTGEFLLALCSGAKIVFSSDPFQPLNVLQIMKEQAITVFGHTPTMVSSLARFKRTDDDFAVRLLSISGECMNEGMAQRIRRAFPNAEIYCGYGLSEASPRVAYLPARLFDQKPTSAGIPLPSVKIRIADSNGKDVKKGEIGELLVRGPNVMKKYFKDKKRTRDVLKNGWLHTGDLAKWGPDKMIYIMGRKDDMIIRAGMNIYPAEIENALSQDARVIEATAYGYQNKDTQEIGLAVCGNFSSKEEILKLCREKLPGYQIPSRVEIIHQAQTQIGGKKKRSQLCTNASTN